MLVGGKKDPKKGVSRDSSRGDVKKLCLENPGRVEKEGPSLGSVSGKGNPGSLAEKEGSRWTLLILDRRS